MGDTLTVRGRVKSREPEGGNVRVTVEVWCENQDGVKTMVGTASGLEADAQLPDLHRIMIRVSCARATWWRRGI